MSDIVELERRMGAALDRIARAAEQAARRPEAPPQAPPTPDAEELARLRAALEAERSANARLNERVAAIKDRQDGTVTQMDRKLARLTDQLDVQGLELQRLRKANLALIEANRALSEQLEARLPDPAALSRSVTAELEALRADRRAELAELEEVLGALAPLVAERNDA